MIKTRKKRSDRKHLIYEIRFQELLYIGVTYVEKGAVNKSLKRRWQKHVQRALKENKDWSLCKAIREHGQDSFQVSVVSVIIGKTEAHKTEREMIKSLNPNLNTDKRGV